MVCKCIFAFCWLLVLRIYLFVQVVQCIGYNCLWLSLLVFCVSVLSVLTSHSLFLIWVFSFSFSLANSLSILFIFSQSNSQFHWSFMLIFWSISFISALIFVVSFLLSTLSLQVKVAQLCLTLCNPMDCSPWNCSGQNTGMGSFSFLQGTFPTQGSNPGFLHCRQILYQLSHKGSLRILEWVDYPFSSGSSWPMNETGVSCIAGGFFTNWAIREAHRLFCF